MKRIKDIFKYFTTSEKVFFALMAVYVILDIFVKLEY